MFRVIDVIMVVMQQIMSFARGGSVFAMFFFAGVMGVRRLGRRYQGDGGDGREKFEFKVQFYGSVNGDITCSSRI